ncbi:MAG: hotdog fold thioesterase [Nitrospiraceae bacterium]|nr:hotdog fold thioesterase [Nitrospiraceae bacterium]
MLFWKTKTTLAQLKELSKNTLVEHLGIEFLEIGDDYLKAKMPVDYRTKQPAGLLHGGASVVLAETLGSVAAGLSVNREKKGIVGIEINANHIRPVTDGWVTGITKPIHIGNTTQIWEIKIYNEQDSLICISRLTVANIDKPINHLHK